VRQRDGHLAEHRRPELADPQRRAAIRQIDECETDAELRLLIPERGAKAAGNAPKKSASIVALGDHFAEHRRTVEGKVDARVPDVAVEDTLVEAGLGQGRPLAFCPFPKPPANEPRSLNSVALTKPLMVSVCPSPNLTTC